jgi:hypothetical protein
MRTMPEQRPWAAGPAFAGALVGIAVVTALRLYFLALDRFDLSGDEAQYWTWAQSPAFGYYSKPPLVAWVIWLTTQAFGDEGFGVRMASPIAHAATALILFAVGARLYDPRIGFWSAILFVTLPATWVSSALISTDPFLLMFWALALYAAVRIAEGGGTIWWIWLGLAVGIGALAKFAMAMFFLGIPLLLAVRPEVRRAVAWYAPVVAVVAAALCYLPNLLWNLDNALVSYRHTADNANLGGPLVNPTKFFEFFFAQFGVFGPIPFAVLLIALATLPTLARDRRTWVLTAPILPLAVMMLSVALISRANANWAAPIYVSATVLVAAWLIERGRVWLLTVAVAIHLAVGGVMFGFHDIARLAGIELTQRTDPFKRLIGWRELGPPVAYELAIRPNTVLLAEDRMFLAQLVYLTRSVAADYAKWSPDGRVRDHYDLTADARLYPNRDFLLVTPNPAPQSVIERFASAELVRSLRSRVYPDLERRHYLFLLRGFRGYGR